MTYNAFWVRVNEVLEARAAPHASQQEIGTQWFQQPRPDPFKAALAIRLARNPGVRPVATVQEKY